MGRYGVWDDMDECCVAGVWCFFGELVVVCSVVKLVICGVVWLGMTFAVVWLGVM